MELIIYLVCKKAVSRAVISALQPQIKNIAMRKKLEFEHIHSQVLVDTADNLKRPGGSMPLERSSFIRMRLFT